MVAKSTGENSTMNLEQYKFPENEDEWRKEFAKYVPFQQAKEEDEILEAAEMFLEVNPKCEMEVSCLLRI